MKKTALLIGLMTATMGALAQQVHPARQDDNHHMILVGETTAVDTAAIYRAFLENAPKMYNIPGAPRFAIIGNQEKFYLGIGGAVKTTLSYDFSNPISSPTYFEPADIPMGPTANPRGNGGQFAISAQQTQFYFNAVAFPQSKYKVGIYINFDLCTSNYSPNLQYAYLTFCGFTAGANYSLFLNTNAAAPTVDKENANALTYAMNQVLQYQHTFKNNITLAIGAEIGPKSFTNAPQAYSVNQRVPDIPAYIQYTSKSNPNNSIRFSVIGRDLQYFNMNKGKVDNVWGGGVKVSGTLGIIPNLIAYYQAGYGKGITGYFQDMQTLGLDLTPDPVDNGKMIANKAWGAYLGLQYNWSPKCYSAVLYSQTRNYAKKFDAVGTTSGTDDFSTSWGDQYKYGQYFAANVFYNISSQFSWGLEWDWGRRVNHDGLSRHDNRIQTMLQLTF